MTINMDDVGIRMEALRIASSVKSVAANDSLIPRAEEVYQFLTGATAAAGSDGALAKSPESNALSAKTPAATAAAAVDDDDVWRVAVAIASTKRESALAWLPIARIAVEAIACVKAA